MTSASPETGSMTSTVSAEKSGAGDLKHLGRKIKIKIEIFVKIRQKLGLKVDLGPKF